MQILPVILSGGSGTRLWPVSRSGYPKQLQALLGKKTLLQQTAKRLPVAPDVMAPVVVCNEDQRFLVAEQLREEGIEPSLIALEPVARSTAPAIAIPALWAKKPEETVLVVMPADHYISDAEAFAQAIRHAAAQALSGKMMTLGIQPTKPHTGFGYIAKGETVVDDKNVFTVSEFKEKPDAATAQAYLDSGRYLWNAGIFILRADVYLAELARLQPAMLHACQEAFEKGKTDLDFLRLDATAFASSPSISIDYAVMEKAQNVGVLPVSFGWSDIGGWPAIWEMGDKDAQGNVLDGDVIAQETSSSYIRSEGRLVTTIGVEDLVIVDTLDALFVAKKDRADDVKDIVAKLKRDGRPEGDLHRRVWRPWGSYETLIAGARFQVKQIMVKPGGKLSLQMHHHRSEHWVVVSGTAKVTCGEDVRLLGPNESAYIPLGVKHRLENMGLVPVYLIEVQSGDYLGEDDIVRLDDVYKR